MTLTEDIRASVREVGFALRRPEELTLRWRDKVNPPSRTVFFVLLFVNLTNAVPVTPGQVGLFEAAATAACLVIGASPEQGFALGVLYHLMQVIPETAESTLQTVVFIKRHFDAPTR